MTVYIFNPVGLDRFSPHSHTPAAGTRVRKVQPHGCPRNGTMGFCYVEGADTGTFHGLVLLASLTKEPKLSVKGVPLPTWDEVRDGITKEGTE